MSNGQNVSRLPRDTMETCNERVCLLLSSIVYTFVAVFHGNRLHLSPGLYKTP